MKRREFLQSATAFGAASMLSAPAVLSANAQSRQETLLFVTESGPNNFDIHGVGTNRPGYEVSWNCYDRLMSHDKKTLADGTESYDRDKFAPELAEDWTTGDMSITFKLRKDATFHDGTPITAKDVKWSFDRAVTVGGFPTFQMKAGSLEKPEQFVAVDDHTFRVDFIRKDKLTLPDLAVIVPAVYHSELVKKNATEKDPWGLEYTKNNIAGGGAYKVARWQAGSEVVYERNENWKSGPLPKIKRVVWRMVPSAGNRRALIERGDADISFDLPNKDFAELRQAGKVTVTSTPIGNGVWYLGMNCKKEPFDNVKVRQAVAYAIPYQKIMDAVMFGLANPMYGAEANKALSLAWPQPHGYTTDLAKAKALLAEAGYPNGLRDHALLRPRLRGDQRAAVRARAGEPRPDRHQGHHQQDPRRQLAQRAPQEGAADDRQLLLRLARLSRVLLLLVLSRAERRLQHDELPGQGDGRADRGRAQGGGRERRRGLREERQGLRRQGLRRSAAHPAVPALSQRRAAEEHLRLSLLVPPAARLPLAGEGVST